MAIQFRANRKTPWVVYWQNPYTAKRESKAFLCKNDAEEFNVRIKYKLEYERHFFLPEEFCNPDTRLTFDEVYALYIKEKAFSGRNLAVQIRNLRMFFEAFGTKTVEDISKKDVKAIMVAMKESGCKQSTVYIRVRHFLAVLNWAEREEYIATNPVQGLSCPRGEIEVIPPPTTEELALIYAHAPEHLQRAMIIAVATGLRPASVELFPMRWQDFDFSRKMIRVYGAAKGQRVGRIQRWRDIPMKEELIAVFQTWKKADSYLGLAHDYIIHFRGKPISSVKTAWGQAKKRAGITRKLRPYDMRHFFVTAALANGADIKTVATLAGHADAQMILKHYQHVQEHQKKNAIVAVPSIPMKNIK